MDSNAPDLVPFWGKSEAGGVPHSLVGHLLDTAAVGELIWDEFMAPAFREQVQAATAGKGRDLFRLLCGVHDLGKATVAFQSKANDPRTHNGPQLVSALTQAGLTLRAARTHMFHQWPHPRGSVAILRAFVEENVSSTQASTWRWVYPLIDGHHGMYDKPTTQKAVQRYIAAHGTGLWETSQRRLLTLILESLEIEIGGFQLSTPSRGIQLALGGFLVMADWVASSDQFPGDDLHPLNMSQARVRASAAWEELGLDSGWQRNKLLTSVGDFASRFNHSPRTFQRDLLLAIQRAEATPGLIIVEAPMGEGKTEAGLAAGEILAQRRGLSGLMFAMPTQGTTDAMYERVTKWLAKVDPRVPVSLLHGKAMLNESWVELVEQSSVRSIGEDMYGMPEEYPSLQEEPQTAAPSSWLLGRHRGLLAPVAVGTVDQVLWAATRTRFVALRHAGLSRHVLIIDEVHSYDAYMNVFLKELLRWCARLGTPVVLMSATLPPELREELVVAWRHGAGLPEAAIDRSDDYPRALLASADSSLVSVSSRQYREDLSVTVEVLPTDDPNDTAPIAAAAAAQVADGGVALIILNTVSRAQEVARTLRGAGTRTLLIHSRLTAAERARRTAKAVDALGRNTPRPNKMVIVATQVAEQSFDVDADVLITDICPMDLLLQRIGRLHRHTRPASERPVALQSPKVVVTGLAWDDGLPVFAEAFSSGERPVYRERPLLASALALAEVAEWSVPSQVPTLVASAYSSGLVVPDSWASRFEAANDQVTRARASQEALAETWRLDREVHTLDDDIARLHEGGDIHADDSRGASVRDIEEQLEVSLIVENDDGQIQTLSGRPLGPNGARAADKKIAREVLADSVRLGKHLPLDEIGPLPQWATLPLLAKTPVLVLDSAHTARLGRWLLTYDAEDGLSTTHE